MPLGQTSFEAYRQETEAFVQANRTFVSQDREYELANNSPREWRPEGQPTKGILFVHGLGDSPWSFTDLGPALAAKGFLVRAILLPGCGTNPAEMIDVRVEDWRRAVAEQADILGREVDELYLGGFSNGSNLALEYAYAHPRVKGLILFSPAVKSGVGLAFLAPLTSVFKDWILKPDPGEPDKDSWRYAVVPTNAFAQYHYASRTARKLLSDKPFDRPVAMVLVENDSVVDIPYMVRLFEERFTNPTSRLIYYGQPIAGLSNRVLFRPDKLPEYRISSFSHMGVMFAPNNPAYGFNTKSPLCQNGQSDEATARCLAGDEVWYSAWGLREPNKIHARLTFNPYFDWQLETLLGVFSPVPGRALTDAPIEPPPPPK
jgi:esterase/lipase